MRFSPQIPNILEIVNVNGHTVDWIVKKITSASDIGQKFMDTLRQLSCAMSSEPDVGPATLTPSYMLKLLKINNIGFEIGGFGGLGGNSIGLQESLKFSDAIQLGTTMLSLPEKSNTCILLF